MTAMLTTQDLKNRLDASLERDQVKHMKKCRCLGTHKLNASTESVGFGIALQARTGTYFDILMAEALERIGDDMLT